MLAAARLPRFTDLPVQEIGHRTGFRDPLSPPAYRARVQGKSMHP